MSAPRTTGPAEAAPPLLRLSGVRAAYGSIEVLHGVDLVVPVGSVVALLGPNGAGKTTTLNVACGLIAPTSGKVFIAGRDVTGVVPEKLARRGVVTIPEGKGVFPNLTVRENLQMSTYAQPPSTPLRPLASLPGRLVARVLYSGRKLSEIEAVVYERFPRLGERRRQLAGTLSGGEQQMLALGRGLASDPALLFLDEMSMGLAPLVVEELYGIVAQIARTGVSVLVVEQFARTVLGVADQAAIMVGGRVRQVGNPAEIEHELSTAYLGG